MKLAVQRLAKKISEVKTLIPGQLTSDVAEKWIASNYPKSLAYITPRQQLALERRFKDESTKATNKILTAHLRLGFVPQWRTSEENACQLLLGNVIYCTENLVAFNKPPGLAVQDGAGLSYSIDSLSDRILFLLKKTGRFKGCSSEKIPKMMKIVHRLDQDVSGKFHGVKIILRAMPSQLSGYMTFRLMQFQLLPSQPLTISTYYTFNLTLFQPKLFLAT